MFFHKKNEVSRILTFKPPPAQYHDFCEPSFQKISFYKLIVNLNFHYFCPDSIGSWDVNILKPSATLAEAANMKNPPASLPKCMGIGRK